MATASAQRAPDAAAADARGDAVRAAATTATAENAPSGSSANSVAAMDVEKALSPNGDASSGQWSRPLVLALAVIASLSGVLFGYDASSINDALPLLSDEFGLSDTMQGVVTSVLLLGAVVGSLFAGIPADRLGRRWTVILSGFMFIAGCILASYVARTVGIFIAGRILIGAAIGVTSAVTPLYIAEMAPPQHRGGLVMFYQLSITIGILIALAIGHALYEQRKWRLMIFLAVVPAALQIFGMLFVPESPRFLLRKGRREEARNVLIRIRGSEAAADAELAEIELIRQEEGRVSWKDVFGPRYRGPMAAGIGLAVISALCGINAIMYYSTKMFKIAGQSNATLSSLAVGITNFGASVISLWIVNSFRRRTLLFIGSAGQIVGLGLAAAPLLASAGHVSAGAGWIMVTGVLFFVVNFAYSSGPLAWVVISEVFPLGARGRGAGVATAANWLSNYVVALVLPVALGSQEGADQQRRCGYVFIAFGVIVVLSIFYIAAFVPETHHLSLEEIEEQFEGRRARKNARHSARKEAKRRASSGGANAEDPTPAGAPGKRGLALPEALSS